MTTQTTHKRPKMRRQLDGGYSGALTVTAAASNDGTVMVFVDSELLGNLVLTAAEAAVSTALHDAASEGLPPSTGSVEAFEQVFGRRVPAKHSRTAADLRRLVDKLSDSHVAARVAAFEAGFGRAGGTSV
jgi:hypothetical protein